MLLHNFTTHNIDEFLQVVIQDLQPIQKSLITEYLLQTKRSKGTFRENHRLTDKQFDQLMLETMDELKMSLADLGIFHFRDLPLNH